MTEAKFVFAMRFALLTFLIVALLVPPMIGAKVNRATVQVGVLSGIIVLIGALLVNYFML